MYKAGLDKFNVLTGDMVRNDKGDYTITPYTLRDGSKWDKTTDNFYQNHNILSATWTPSSHWSHSLSLHYTYGYGYYKEFKNNAKFAKFGLIYKDAEGNKVKKSDFIRKKGLTQHTYGMVYNTNYKDEHWDVIGGLNLQQFRGNHWDTLLISPTRMPRRNSSAATASISTMILMPTSMTTAPSSRQAIALQTTGMPSLTCSIAV